MTTPIVVSLPTEGATCEVQPEDNRNELVCLVPMQNEQAWHELYGGHLGQDALGQYWTWWGNDAPSVRVDLVAPEEE